MRSRAAKRPVLVLTVACAMLAGACGSSVPGSVQPAASARPLATPPDGGSVAVTPSKFASPPPAGPGGATAATVATSSPPSSPPAQHLHLVAIGDSLAQGEASSCPGCMDYVDLYGQAIAAATGRPVDVDNRTAIQLSGLPPIQATQLMNELLTDGAMRKAISGADIIIVNVGFNDTPWNRLDNPCSASNLDVTVVQWKLINQSCIARATGEYKQTLDEILTQVNELRGCARPIDQPVNFCSQIGRQDTVLRVMTVFDDWIGEAGTPAAALAPTEAADRAFVAAQCWEAIAHGGLCADEYHALNGPTGTADAAQFLVGDHTHLNQAGHLRVAHILAALGYAPLE